MEIVIIGTGNVATILGRKCKEAGHVIRQVLGRNAAAADALAAAVQAPAVYDWSRIEEKADLYLLAVSDKAIEEVAQKMELNGKTVVHTAASVSKEILAGAAHYGVFYPLQSLRKETAQLPEIPLFIDASDEYMFNLLQTLAQSISKNVMQATDEQRMKLHLAAVFANNFVNHLYVLTEKYCQQEGIDFELLLPLIKETANRMEQMQAAGAQTGPAIRQDEGTIQKHLALLNGHPSLQNWYALFTESIQKQQ